MTHKDWFQQQTPEKLKEIRVSRRQHEPEWQMADDAIREKESVAAKSESDRLEKIHSQRHQEVIVAQQQLKRAVEQVHRVDIAILIAGVIAAIAGLLLLLLDLLRVSGAGK